ncbi:HD domain-containing protein [Methanocalculus chunghsingensis]|uniref:HD domain-containing protein n=1 Tax=Methanocalculus chunghsingensis TaxID=156457 RepID=UPI001B8BFA05|nr:HD domain-containing protein [Methanocalculus chunghsingensis]
MNGSDRDVLKRIAVIRSYGHSLSVDREHDEQVKKNALLLFDGLRPLHALGEDARFLLAAAALLHDIGWSQGPEAHHKSSQRLIMEDHSLPLDERERTIIGLLARYHRKAFPSMKHRGFADQNDEDRSRIGMLASILRIADGLDRTHRSLVKDIRVTITGDRVTISCSSDQGGDAEWYYGTRKADLFTRIFGREVAIEWIVED